ncbi:MAG: hypothetical protein AAB658_04730, partial [Chloroflexota bacterium]
MNQLGDDYSLFNKEYLGLDVMRFVGGPLGGNRISMDFYDAAGVFIEDIVLGTLSVGVGINVVIFTTPLTIPPQGWIVMRTADDFAPNTRFVWRSTTAAGGVGSNNPNRLWINGPLPPTADNNFLKMCDNGPRKNESCVAAADCPNGACVAAPGILAYELVGDKVDDPVGGCCKQASGDCESGVISWMCDARGDIYLGNGSICAACNGGGNSGLDCRSCSITTTTVCTLHSQCPSGELCVPNEARCPGNRCSTGLVGNNCAIDDDCDLAGLCDISQTPDRCSVGKIGERCSFCVGGFNAGAVCETGADCRVCSIKKCSGAPAETVCTGTGQGSCPAGQTCNFIVCTSDTPCTPVGGGTCPSGGACTPNNAACDIAGTCVEAICDADQSACGLG